MSIDSIRSNEIFSNLSASEADSQDAVPNWLKERRERSAAGTVSSPADAPAVSNPPPVAKAGMLTRVKVKPKAKTLSLQVADSKKPEMDAEPNWFREWLKSNNAIGVATSFCLHSLLLATLAFVVISTATPHEVVNLWGTLVDGEEGGSDTLIDTVVPNDAGESSPLEVADMSQTWESIESGMAEPESGRIGFGGKGQGIGEAGNGPSIGVPSVGVPGHAQRKGNFSAWTEPRDPKPHENYTIVIQVKLPANVKKFRASDLKGLVTGTDRYLQKISYRSTEQFPVENGVVEIRIIVPGAEMRVRDTIQIESKLLREKQTFEIEF